MPGANSNHDLLPNVTTLSDEVATQNGGLPVWGEIFGTAADPKAAAPVQLVVEAGTETAPQPANEPR